MIFSFDKFKIRKFCHFAGIKNYTINKDNSVDVNGNVDLGIFYIAPFVLKKGHFKDKLPIKFGKINGNFSIYNSDVITLEGCPKHVSGNFNCSANRRLKSLKGCPGFVGGRFIANNCDIRSLEGISNSIGLDRSFSSSRETLDLSSNKNLTDLIDFPNQFKGDFTFIYSPIDEIFRVFKIGCAYVNGQHYIKNEKILNLLIEYDVVQGTNIIEDRLEEVYHTLNLPVPKLNFKNYNLI